MIKVVYSPTFGGFGLSKQAEALYEKLSGNKIPDRWKLARHDPILVQVVEQLGANFASGDHADLRIYEIPGCEYKIDEYDGNESVEYPGMDQDWVLVDTPSTRNLYPEKFL